LDCGASVTWQLRRLSTTTIPFFPISEYLLQPLLWLMKYRLQERGRVDRALAVLKGDE
jgi:hypothetical protein